MFGKVRCASHGVVGAWKRSKEGKSATEVSQAATATTQCFATGVHMNDRRSVFFVMRAGFGTYRMSI